MRKSGNMLFVAVLIAALGSAMVYRYLRTQQAELDEAKQRAMGQIVEIVVADAEVPIGTTVKEGQLKLVKWPKEAEPVGAIYKTDEVAGRIARVTIRRNQPLNNADLISGQASLLPLLIEEGMRAMSVKVDRVTGVSGFITPNSRVDVLAAGNVPEPGGGERQQRSKLILQNVKVLATGTDIEQREDGPVEVPVVTLLVSPGDSEKLTLATKDEPVRLALRNYRDDAGVPTSGMSMPTLFGIVAPPPPPPPPKAVAAAVRRPPSMEILMGEELTRQSY